MTLLSLRRRPKVVAVVAAYNEGPRIRKVLEVLVSYPGFEDVIVVDDGSTDTTLVEALVSGATVITQQNMGKGAAMNLGVQSSGAGIIFFCDADIIGLTHEMISAILHPVLYEETCMMVAMRDRSAYSLPFVLDIVAHLGGERAVTRELWESVPDEFKKDFMIETALNYYASRNGGYEYEAFPGLTQVIKETKRGLVEGLTARLKMFYDIIKSHVVLRLS